MPGRSRVMWGPDAVGRFIFFGNVVTTAVYVERAASRSRALHMPIPLPIFHIFFDGAQRVCAACVGEPSSRRAFFHVNTGRGDFPRPPVPAGGEIVRMSGTRTGTSVLHDDPARCGMFRVAGAWPPRGANMPVPGTQEGPPARGSLFVKQATAFRCFGAAGWMSRYFLMGVIL